ncbi:hypothetical protein H4S06_000050 [Coemansia sp. BCRC 34490]|nr:hypothetical protein H4S06_000050 [Coemansia sp. BCRC 34490]
MDRIIIDYNARAESSRGRGHLSEDKIQTRTDALVSSVQDMLTVFSGGELELRWMDTHRSTIQTLGRAARKPDGVFYLRKSGASPHWPFVAVPVEVKSSKVGSQDSVLNGQLIWSYIDMARDQPRRFILGLSISKGGELHAQICMPNGVLSAWIGSLPTPADRVIAMSDAQKDAVRFLILIFQLLPNDYGYLVRKPRGIHEAFSLSDIPGLSLDGIDEEHRGSTIAIQQVTAKGGRREAITGPRSWVFPVNVVSPSAKNSSKHYMLKFHWYYAGKSEAKIHEQVQTLGAPYVPNLIFASSIDDKTHINSDVQTIGGEVLLMEYAGKSVSSLFCPSKSISVSRVADVFAGYVHTLLAANEGNESVFVLHRDISENNLLVRDGATPFIIDWGCGIVATKGKSRMTSVNSMVGTAVFMGLRVLKQFSQRSFVDDLESVFLVFALCVWERYGSKTSLYKGLWESNDDTQNVITSRCFWLSSELSFVSEMKLSNCPRKLEILATDLYNLIFPTGISAYELIQEDGDDPRMDKIDPANLFTIFKTAVEQGTDSAIYTDDTLKHIHALGRYVNTIGDSHNSNSNQEPSALKIKRNVDQSSPTSPTNKKQRR